MKLAFILLFFSALSKAAASPAPRQCDKLSYSDPKLVPIKGRIVSDFSQDNKNTNPLGCADPRAGKCSPDYTSKLVIKNPDFTKQGPWNTEVEIVSGRGSPARSGRIFFNDHYHSNVEAKWTSEKLIFIRVFWGRIVSTEMVVDAQLGNAPYLQDVSHELIECKE